MMNFSNSKIITNNWKYENNLVMSCWYEEKFYYKNIREVAMLEATTEFV